jgi:cytochrome c peroxidase
MNATRKPFVLLLLTLTACGKWVDDLFCEPGGCAWQPGEWERVAALANPGLPPRDRSNFYSEFGLAQKLGQAFFFDPAFSGTATQKDAINRTSPPARAGVGEPIGISCATCHDLSRAGVDTTPPPAPGHVSVGAGWTDVNALPVVNSAYRQVVFWNGRADSLWALNVVVAESPTTLNGNRLRTAHQIAERYGPAYDQVFAREYNPLPIATIAALPPNGKKGAPEYEALPPALKGMVDRILVNWAKAIAAYEQTLISVDSPFDRYVAEGPDSDAISPAARRGARLFVGKAACSSCHSGPHLTDELFHNIGIPQTGEAVPKTTDCPKSADPETAAAAACDCFHEKALKCAPWGAYDGLRRLRTADEKSPIYNRWSRTGSFSDAPSDTSRQAYYDLPLTESLKGAWRTPSLRNVGLTAPYMHDGRYATLDEVVWHYNTGGSGAGSEQVGHLSAQIKPLGLTDAEMSDLVAFLQSLTGSPLPSESTVAPPLPPSRGGAGGTGGTFGTSATGTGGTFAAGGMGGTFSAGVGGGPPPRGGAPGRGGTFGTGGIGGIGTGGALGCPGLATFDTSAEGFALNVYNTEAGNLAIREGGPSARGGFYGGDGSPAFGSLRIDAPFNDYNQFVDVQKATNANWTGYKLHVRVKIASGLNPPFSPPFVQPYANSYDPTSSGDSHFKGFLTAAVAGYGWNEYVADIGTPEGDFDPSRIINFGVIVGSGSGLTADGGIAPPAKPVPAAIFVDSFWLEGSCGAAGAPSP